MESEDQQTTKELLPNTSLLRNSDNSSHHSSDIDLSASSVKMATLAGANINAPTIHTQHSNSPPLQSPLILVDTAMSDLDPFPSYMSPQHQTTPTHPSERESRTPPRSPKPSRSSRPISQHAPHSPHAMDIDGLPLSPSLEPTLAPFLTLRMEPPVSEAGAEMLLCQPSMEGDTDLENKVSQPHVEHLLWPEHRLSTTGPGDRNVKSQSDSGVDLTADVEGDVPMLDVPPAVSLHVIPPFYFPIGTNPDESSRKPDGLAQKQLFGVDSENLIGRGLSERDFEKVTERCQLPRYLNACLFRQCGGERDKPVFFQAFQQTWSALTTKFRGEDSLAFGVFKQNVNNFIEPEDIELVVTDVVHHHPGLVFLAPLPVFQARYVETVVARIFYGKTQNWNDRMTFAEFKKTGILNVIRNLENQDDINSTRDVFSYKHFYVIYCKFWELDSDHDMQIDRRALSRYDRSSIIPRVVTRIAEGAGRPVVGARNATTMGYRDFIWFILSNEDKRTPQGIEYWFRVLDTDGDGLISLHELQYFWEEQHAKMIENRLADPWKFDDFVCALLDLVKPVQKHAVSLHDLKKCGSASIFFDMIFDLKKYDSFIRRIDPAWREMDDVVVVDGRGRRVKLEGWDKFAERAYEELAIEESQQRNTNYRTTARYVYSDDDDDTAEVWSVNHRSSNSSTTGVTTTSTSPSLTATTSDEGNGSSNSSSNNAWSGGMFSHTDDDDAWEEDDDADVEPHEVSVAETIELSSSVDQPTETATSSPIF
ncbi:hypothetical protein SmJEL517_g05581 [Synchytrium microbalum]|uniref:EF-hand domain-containing protein n=1 Tax=Synchytrium microbalum TaxID=1806994 RepID=A0A507BZ40_9FUNG|nr:uncharacterized protein SmJEL517_g05581 [Synchytrium microbalum]TPX31016.1 hypothetical protein SmJEL517_g05581 [Synchytrium microbalum]